MIMQSRLNVHGDVCYICIDATVINLNTSTSDMYVFTNWAKVSYIGNSGKEVLDGIMLQ